MRNPRYRSYLLTVLLLLLAFNFVDRLAFGLLLEEIKADLRLSDTELGVLTGIAFALFYSLFGIPIARWADRGNRVLIISLTAALWSVLVALCGTVGSFAQLLLIRTGIAIGEAGCVPPAHSLLADYFTRAERPRAMARYSLGGPLSLLIGYFLAGWLNELYGWRLTFGILGLPCLGLAALAWFTLKEPRLDAHCRASGDSPSLLQFGFKETASALWRNATFRHLLFFFCIVQLFGSGILQWQPAFFVRSHGLKTAELGAWFAAIYGAGGALGMWLGGEWAARRARGKETLQLQATAVVYAGFALVSAFIYLSPDRRWAFLLMGIAALGGAATTGPVFATVQTLVPARMRATSIAFLYLFSNLIGLGLGPLAAGVLSDVLRPHFGEESLRYALLTLCPGYVWGAWHLWRASKTVARDLHAAAEQGEGLGSSLPCQT